MVGTSMLLGGIEATRAVVVCAGEGYCLHHDVLKAELEHSPELLHLLLTYVQALLIQTSQTAVCNRHHTIDQQLCRWLLLTLDRMTTNKMRMTQELIAQMLGVRREGVTAAAGNLQDACLIQYSRGIITVLDRKGLEDRVCECYETVKKEIDRLVPVPIGL